MSTSGGILYVIATPIGNLKDISTRAGEVLGNVDLILAEDTRHSKVLLDHLNVKTPVRAYHDFNEAGAAEKIIDRLLAGANVGLISDAGTPLISDPGYRLVCLAHERGIRVVPLPGCSALTAALSVSGLPTDRFTFEGFLPEKQAARVRLLESLKSETRTMVFYEVPHRILASMRDLSGILGAGRRVCLCRELTKKFETIITGSLAQVLTRLEQDTDQQRGEFVLVVCGAETADAGNADAGRVLRILLESGLSVKAAAAAAARITGGRKNDLYRLAITIGEDTE